MWIRIDQYSEEPSNELRKIKRENNINYLSNHCVLVNLVKLKKSESWKEHGWTGTHIYRYILELLEWSKVQP